MAFTLGKYEDQMLCDVVHIEVILKPLSLKEVNEDHIKMKLRREKENKMKEEKERRMWCPKGYFKQMLEGFQDIFPKDIPLGLPSIRG
ncbi:hypothetical protein CR513_07419, partial [Mucuna pruriens]